MSFGGVEGLSPPPHINPELEHWFAQITAQLAQLNTSVGTHTHVAADVTDFSTAVETAVEAGSYIITGDWLFQGSLGYDLTDDDLVVGDANYGILRLGSARMGRTDHTAAMGAPAYNLNGTFFFRNTAGPVTGDIEFAFLDSAGLVRFALPKSAVGNATYNPRSMIIAGPAVADSDEVTVAYWQSQGIFHNLTMNTAANGADLGVQNDLEVEGQIFVNLIEESTPASGVSIPDLTAASVTQHQAALTILESQITDGAILARVASAETITGTWVFAGAGGAADASLAVRPSGTGAGYFRVYSDPGVTAGYEFRDDTSGTQRWLLYKAVAETGSNAGSDLYLAAYSDAGAYLGSALKITRSDFGAQFYGRIGIPDGGSASTPAIYFSANTTTGFYRYATDDLAVTIAGVRHVSFNSAGLQLVAAQIYQDGYYDNGTIGSGATLNVNWNGGNSQKCACSAGNITIDVDQTSAKVGTSYTMKVRNIGGSARTVTWAGVDEWKGTAPTASIGAGNQTTVQFFIDEFSSGARYIIGSWLLDNKTVT